MSNSQEQSADRSCSRCGKSVEDGPYVQWLFHACESCAAENAPPRWTDAGTARKWRYWPLWHFSEVNVT